MSDDARTAVRLVKLGGSLITDKGSERRARPEVLARLAGELVAAGPRRVLLGHGSGSFGHMEAARYGLRDGMRGPEGRRGVVATQRAAAELHALVLAALVEAGATPFSLSPSSFLVTASRQPVVVAAEPLERALEQGLLPVTHGDVVMDRQLGACVCSTETALLALAQELLKAGIPVREAVWCGDTAGVLDADGETISRIAADDPLPGSVGGSGATDVTGGMRHRLETALRLARLGVPSWIIDGGTPGGLTAALEGERVRGTRVAARRCP